MLDDLTDLDGQRGSGVKVGIVRMDNPEVMWMVEVL
jgi:hypothetical protein